MSSAHTHWQPTVCAFRGLASAGLCLACCCQMWPLLDMQHNKLTAQTSQQCTTANACSMPLQDHCIRTSLYVHLCTVVAGSSTSCVGVRTQAQDLLWWCPITHQHLQQRFTLSIAFYVLAIRKPRKAAARAHAVETWDGLCKKAMSGCGSR